MFVASVGSEVFEVPEVVESELDVVDEVVLDALEDFSEDEVVDVPVDAEVVEVVEVDVLDSVDSLDCESVSSAVLSSFSSCGTRRSIKPSGPSLSIFPLVSVLYFFSAIERILLIWA